MSTTTTDSGFYWYLRTGPKVNTLGIVNEDGAAVDSALTVELHTELADDTGDWNDDAEFLLPERFMLPFVKGVINEYMHMNHGQADQLLMMEFEEAKRKMMAINRTQKYSGDFMKPMNLRSDRDQYVAVRSTNA